MLMPGTMPSHQLESLYKATTFLKLFAHEYMQPYFRCAFPSRYRQAAKIFLFY